MLDHVDTRGRGSRERARILDTRNVTETARTNRSGIYAWFTKHETRFDEKIDRLKIDRWNSTVDLAMLAMASMSTWRSARCSGLGKTAPPRVTYQAKCQFGVSALLQVP